MNAVEDVAADAGGAFEARTAATGNAQSDSVVDGTSSSVDVDPDMIQHCMSGAVSSRCPGVMAHCHQCSSLRKRSY